MKPKELLKSKLENSLIPQITDLGFKYSIGQIGLVKKLSNFKLKIDFCLSKWNEENDCEFWTMWSISSNYYSKWYLNEWGEKPNNNFLVGFAEWNIPGWSRDASNHFRLTNTDRDEKVLSELYKNMIEKGIPYITKFCDWEKAARNIIEDRDFYNKACDFYLIANKPELAKKVLDLGLKELKDRDDQFFVLPEIKKRLQKYFYMQGF